MGAPRVTGVKVDGLTQRAPNVSGHAALHDLGSSRR